MVNDHVALLLVGLLLGGGSVPGGAQRLPIALQSSQPSPVSGTVVLTADVPQDPGALAVQFKLNGYVLDAPDTTPPYEVVWSAASAGSGEYTVTAEARSRSGAVIASPPLRLTVVNPATFNRVLYVDGASGDDGKDGASPATAWRTLEKANRFVVAGDTVLLRGTFSGQHIRPAASGTSAKPITFKSHPGQTAVLEGGRSGVAVWLDARSYIVVEQLRIRNVPGNAIMLDAAAHHNVVRGCQISNIANASSWGSAIRITRSSDNLVERNEINDVGPLTADSGDSLWIDNGSSRNRILGNTLRNAGHSLIMIGGDRLGDAEVGDNVVAGNTLSNPYGTLMNLSWVARRTLVERNRLSEANRNGTNRTATGIQIMSRDNVIRYNEFLDNATTGISLLGYVYSSGIAQDAIGNQIYHNVFYGGGNAAIWIFEKNGRSVRDNLIASNIFFRNAGFASGDKRYMIAIEHFHNPTAWPEGSLNGNRFANNIVLRQPGAAGGPMMLRIRNPGQGSNLTYTLAQLQASHREATDNLEVDPLFTDEAKRIFTLRPSSPAVDRGLRIPGVAYHGSAPDIGAFEVDLPRRSSVRP